MDTWDSLVKVTHGATVLVNIGDPMFAPVALDGGQVVDVQSLVRAAGIRAVPMGNEQHSISFSLAKEHSSVESALKAAFTAARTAPRSMADVSITFADGSGVMIKNAAVRSWSAGYDAHIGRSMLSITGGELVEITAP